MPQIVDKRRAAFGYVAFGVGLGCLPWFAFLRSDCEEVVLQRDVVLTEWADSTNTSVIQRRTLCDNAIVDKAKARAAIELRERWMTSVEFLDLTHAIHDRGRALEEEKWKFLAPETPVCPVKLTTFGRLNNVDEQKYFCSTDAFLKESSGDSCVVF